MVTAKEELHHLVEEVPPGRVDEARRLLRGLVAPGQPVLSRAERDARIAAIIAKHKAGTMEEAERLELADLAYGISAHLPGTVEEFLREKHEDAAAPRAADPDAAGWPPKGEAMGDERAPSDNGNNRALPLLLIGCAAVGFGIYKAVALDRWLAAQMRDVPPSDPGVIAQQFGDIPVYPGAELNPKATAEGARAAEIVGRIWPFRLFLRRLGHSLQEMASAAFSVDASPPDVVAWYDHALEAEGWVPAELPGMERGAQPIHLRPFSRRHRQCIGLERVYRRGEEELRIAALAEEGAACASLCLSRGPTTVTG